MVPFSRWQNQPINCALFLLAGIVLGLGTYGYKIIRTLGVKMVRITPCRGHVIEISSALVVSLASAYGMPVSTTHCATGATWGAGMMEGRAGVNWKHAGKVCITFLPGVALRWLLV